MAKSCITVDSAFFSKLWQAASTGTRVLSIEDNNSPAAKPTYTLYTKMKIVRKALNLITLPLV